MLSFCCNRRGLQRFGRTLERCILCFKLYFIAVCAICQVFPVFFCILLQFWVWNAIFTCVTMFLSRRGPLGSLSRLVDASRKRFLSRGGLLWGALGAFLSPPERPRAAQQRPRMAPGRPKTKSCAKFKKKVAQRRPQTQNIVKNKRENHDFPYKMRGRRPCLEHVKNTSKTL